jgi:uncharacterized protein (DUF983 family)
LWWVFLHNLIVCSGFFLERTQAYIYIRLIASGIDKIHNCPKCLKEKHFQNLMHMSETPGTCGQDPMVPLIAHPSFFLTSICVHVHNILQLSMYLCMTYIQKKNNQTAVSIHTGFLTCIRFWKCFSYLWSWRVSQTLCYVQHLHTLLCLLVVTCKPNFYFQAKLVNNYMYISIKFCICLLIQDQAQGYLISD